MSVFRSIIVVHLLSLLITTGVNAQHYTDFQFYDAAPANILRAMQNNADAVFQQIHAAHFIEHPVVTLSRDNATQRAIDRIQALWRISTFYCTEYDMVARVVQTQGGYRASGIPVIFVNATTISDKYQHITLEFTPDGRISDVITRWHNNMPETANNVTDPQRRPTPTPTKPPTPTTPVPVPTPTPAPTPMPPTPTPPAPTSSVNKTILLQLVNQHRASGYTCGDTYHGPTTPVEWNDNLELAAHDHSLDMYTHNFFSHTGKDGSLPWDRAERRNYSSRYVGENIYRGRNTEAEAIQAWMRSPGHCSNIMSPNYKEIGVGHVNSYWTMKLGSQ